MEEKSLRQVINIQNKLEKLIVLYEKLQSNNQSLKAQNEDLSQKLKEKQAEIEQLNQDQINLKIAKNLDETFLGKRDALEKIDLYIKQIDDTIALLNTWE